MGQDRFEERTAAPVLALVGFGVEDLGADRLVERTGLVAAVLHSNPGRRPEQLEAAV